MIRLILSACFTFFLALIPMFVSAIDINPPTENLPEIGNASPGDAIASLIQYAIGLTGVLAIIAITWGGITIISGAGSDDKMKKGRKIILYGLVGVFLAGIAYLIVNLIANITIT